MSAVSIRISPASGATIPASRLSSVDFPAPDGPISSSFSPRETVKRSTVSENRLRPGQAKWTPFRATTSSGMTPVAPADG